MIDHYERFGGIDHYERFGGKRKKNQSNINERIVGIHV